LQVAGCRLQVGFSREEVLECSGIFSPMNALPTLQKFIEPWILLLADDPLLRAMQIGLVCIGILVIFTVFYVTRDILLRSHSFLLMFFSILLAAFLPLGGFLLYLLIRPSRTLAQKELDSKVSEIYAVMCKDQKPKKSDAKKEK
jgi:hypothetical protein